MNVSRNGLIALARFEAVVLSAYQDSVKVWTIGVGHTAAAGAPKPAAGMKLSAAEAIDLLRKDLATYEAAVARNVKVALSQNEFDALVSFTFNLGEGNLKSSTLLRKLNAGDKAGAATQFGAWVKAGGKTLQGLVTRRAAERALFERAAYGDLSGVPVYDAYPGKSRVVPASDLFPSATTPAPDAAMPAPEPPTGQIGQSILATLVVDYADLKRRVEILEAERGWRWPARLSEPDMTTSRILTDGSPVTPDHREINPETGQQKGYIVLSAEERAKGFVRPVRRSYVHKTCGCLTTMSLPLAETYAREPSFYSGTFCVGCKADFPLDQFVWDGTDEQVGS